MERGVDTASPGAVRALLRRPTGGMSGTALLVAGLAAVSAPGAGEVLPLLLQVTAAGLVCTVASTLLGGARPPGWRRHVGAGAAVALVVAVLLEGDSGYAPLVAAVAVPLGVVAAAVGTAVARTTPARALVPVLLGAVLLLVGSVGATVLAERPPYDGSYLVVQGPSDSDDALALARRLGAQLQASADPLADRTWSDVAGAAVRTRPGGRSSIGYEADPGERRITVDVDGDLACVVVTPDTARATAGTCA